MRIILQFTAGNIMGMRTVFFHHSWFKLLLTNKKWATILFLRDWKYIQANFWKIHIFFQNFSMYYNTFCTFYFPYFFLLRHSLGQVWTSNNVFECNGMQEYYLGNHSISGISSKNSIIRKKKKKCNENILL